MNKLQAKLSSKIIQKIEASQVDDYTTGCLLDYYHLKILQNESNRFK